MCTFIDHIQTKRHVSIFFLSTNAENTPPAGILERYLIILGLSSDINASYPFIVRV